MNTTMLNFRNVCKVILLLAVMMITSCDKEPLVANVIVSPTNITIEIGGTSELKATLKDASGNILTGRLINWSSSDKSVATVSSSGMITGISTGGPITIKAASEGKSSTAQVIVIPVHIASMTVSPITITLEIGEVRQLFSILKDSLDNILTGRSINWSSSDPALATVSSSGVVTGVSIGGPVIITATSEGKNNTAQVIVISASVASVLINPSSADIFIWKNLQFSATVLDARGVNLADRQIIWSSSNTNIATISSSGLVTGLKPGGPATITATSEGKNGIAQLHVNLPVDVARLLEGIQEHISLAISRNQTLLANNPQIANQLEAKIEMLKSPTLADDIINGCYFSYDEVISIDKRPISISCIFPQEKMRSDANQSVTSVKLAFPLLEDFMETAYDNSIIRIWYGFVMGNSGGIEMEDRETYEARTGPDRIPYEVILLHELSHSYIGNEALTQFLDIYLYNMVHTNSSDINSWIYLQGYPDIQDSNNWLYALLDIYQLIGHNNMSKAYKILYSLHPPYGSGLSNECQQVFIDQAPASVKDQVAVKVGKINGKSGQNDHLIHE